jgi:hypothetical protein
LTDKKTVTKTKSKLRRRVWRQKGIAMQIPLAKMASQILVDLGNFHLAALAQDEATKGLTTGFKPSVDALTAAKVAREQAEQGLISPRVAAIFAEYALESVLREIASRARISDNKAGGELVFKAIFPNGLDAEVRPRGATQLTASNALRGRLDSQPAAASVKAQMLKDLDAALATLSTALEARKNAEHALAVVRAAEDGARATFVSAYDANAGAIRQLFPRNRARQDLYFDQFRADPSADNTHEGGGDSSSQTAPASNSGESKKS